MSRKGDPKDIEEFGDEELGGSPTIAQLIRVLPEAERESYREARRSFLRNMGYRGTYAEYLRGESKWNNS